MKNALAGASYSARLMNVKRWASLAAAGILVATSAFLVIVIWPHAVRQDVDPLHRGVSRYAAGDHTGFGVRHRGIRSLPEGVEGAAAQTEEVMIQAKYPTGWDEARVKGMLAHYEQQSDDERSPRTRAACEPTTHTVMEVPVDLVPAVRELLISVGPDSSD